nr:helitron helicase-like domain-containing protein [Butyricicoccus sp. AF22-28AC]
MTVKRCGNVIEVRYMRSTPCAVIEKVNADLYVDKRTGEVKEFCHSANRADSKASVAQSLRKLRDLINANLTAPETALWVTLTYKENMRDERRVYEDFRRFWQRFRYYLKKHEYRPAEYITAAEPQGRGAWHLHCLFLFPEKAPFIPNADMARIWGHGFTKTKSLQGIDNPGLYLTAYLGDMELSEALRVGNAKGQIAEAEITDAQASAERKRLSKGRGCTCTRPALICTGQAGV